MSTNKKMVNSTSEQLGLLMEYMDNYPAIAKGISNDVNGRQKKEKIWSEMTTKLNAMGPPTRSVDSWKRVLSSNKSKAKAKLGAQVAAKKFNAPQKKDLSPLARSIVNSAGLDAAVRGLNVPTFGVTILPSHVEQATIEDDNEENYNWKDTSYGEMDSNVQQENKILDYMYENPKLANDEFDLNDKTEKYLHDRLWSELKENLNADGPPWHVSSEWKDLWSKKKRETMKKNTSNKKSHFKTGGGPNQHQNLTEIDEAIMSACSSGTRAINVSSFGSEPVVELSDDEPMDELEINKGKENNSSNGNKKNCKDLPSRPISKAQLIQNQTKSNEAFQEKLLALLAKRNEIEMEKYKLQVEQKKDKLDHKKSLLEYKLLKLDMKKASNEIRQQKLDFLKQSN